MYKNIFLMGFLLMMNVSSFASTTTKSYKLNNTSAWRLQVVINTNGTNSSTVYVENDNSPKNINYDPSTISSVVITPLGISSKPIEIQYSKDTILGNILQSATAIAFNNVNGDSSDKSTGLHIYFFASNEIDINKIDTASSIKELNIPLSLPEKYSLSSDSYFYSKTCKAGNGFTYAVVALDSNGSAIQGELYIDNDGTKTPYSSDVVRVADRDVILYYVIIETPDKKYTPKDISQWQITKFTPSGQKIVYTIPFSSTESTIDPNAQIIQVIDSLSDEDMKVDALDASNKSIATITLPANTGNHQFVYSTNATSLLFTTLKSKLSVTCQLSNFGQLRSDGYLTNAKQADGSIDIGFWSLDASGSGKGPGKGGGAKMLVVQNIYALKDVPMVVTALDASGKVISTLNLPANANAHDALQYPPLNSSLIFTTMKDKDTPNLSTTFKISEASVLQASGWLTSPNKRNDDGSISFGLWNIDWSAKGGSLTIDTSSSTSGIPPASSGSTTPPASTTTAITASQITLTGTYTVVKDDLNSRSNYTYPKGTYNGQDVFVYIAKTKNDALGTVVGTISADELGTLKSNNSSNASISASFSSDPKYLADGGFVYSLTSSGSTTTPSASYYVQSATAGTLVLSTSSTTTYPQGTLTLDGTSYNVIVQPNTLSQPSGYTLPFVLITGTDYQNVVKSYNTLLPADAQYANVFQVN